MEPNHKVSILNPITWVFITMIDVSALKKSGFLCRVMISKFQSVIKESTLQEPIAAKSKGKKCEFQYWNFSQLDVYKIFFYDILKFHNGLYLPFQTIITER